MVSRQARQAAGASYSISLYGRLAKMIVEHWTENSPYFESSGGGGGALSVSKCIQHRDTRQ